MPNTLHLVLSGHYVTLDRLRAEAESLAGQTVRLCPSAAQAMDQLQQAAGHQPWREGPIEAFVHRATGCLLIDIDDATLLVGQRDWLPHGSGQDSVEARKTQPPWERDDEGDGEDEEVHDARD